jgi:hypothetical protein
LIILYHTPHKKSEKNINAKNEAITSKTTEMKSKVQTLSHLIRPAPKTCQGPSLVNKTVLSGSNLCRDNGYSVEFPSSCHEMRKRTSIITRPLSHVSLSFSHSPVALNFFPCKLRNYSVLKLAFINTK